MNATVNENCIGCGLCAGTCPEVFRMGDDGVAHGIFSIKQPRRLANALQSVFKSLEVSFIREYEHQPKPRIINEYINILFYGIIK